MSESNSIFPTLKPSEHPVLSSPDTGVGALLGFSASALQTSQVVIIKNVPR